MEEILHGKTDWSYAGKRWLFIRVLNKIRERNIDEDVESTLKLSFLENLSYAKHVAHTSAENKSFNVKPFKIKFLISLYRCNWKIP